MKSMPADAPPRPGLLRRARALLLENHASPLQLSLGVAVGVFIALTPFYLLHTVLAAGLAWVFRLNIGAAVLGTQLSNPFFAPGLIAASLWLGHLMGPAGTGEQAPWNPAGMAFYVSWLRGGLVLGVVLGLALGLATYIVATLAQRRRRHA
jgi:uncharacterized protein (DUF2062 family)